MGWSNLIVGAHELYNFNMAYVNVINTIATFVEPTSPTKIITYETILTQYIIKQGLQIFRQKVKAALRK